MLAAARMRGALRAGRLEVEGPGVNTRYQVTKSPVERYRLRFEAREGFLEACRRLRADGYLLFCSGGCDLVGRLVRFSEEKRVVEVDASLDPDSRERPAAAA